jgi:hypothetical protein
MRSLDDLLWVRLEEGSFGCNGKPGKKLGGSPKKEEI